MRDEKEMLLKMIRLESYKVEFSVYFIVVVILHILFYVSKRIETLECIVCHADWPLLCKQDCCHDCIQSTCSLTTFSCRYINLDNMKNIFS